MTDTLMTMDEAMARLRCSRSLLYKLARKNEIRLVKLCGSTRIPASSLDAYVERVLATPLHPSAA